MRLLGVFQFKFRLYGDNNRAAFGSSDATSKSMPPSATTLAAIPDHAPVLAPFLAPAEGATAYGTDFNRQV